MGATRNGPTQARGLPPGRTLKGTPSGAQAGEQAQTTPDPGRQLAEIQRARIVAAMVAVASEQGVGHATVARVVARSGVSRRTFYEQFEDREACFLAAFDLAVDRAAAVVIPAYEAPGPWRAKMRSALTALLEFFTREPGMARLLVVESLGAGPRALSRRRNVLVQIFSTIDLGRTEVKTGEGPPPLTAEGLAGGVLSLIHARLLARAPQGAPRLCPSGCDGGLSGEDSPVHVPVGVPERGLTALLNPLMAMIVLPYLGPAAARRELALPVPPSPNGSPRAAGDPLRDLEMRLTYRTVRVLLAIGILGEQGFHPSNRQVADAAGIRDQGQVSKLLARLSQLGLIDNAGDPSAKGEPNRWTLTERGSEVREVLSA
jgi:AcrR family transcriptional regulator/DNA-binding MarR family transcriptional regulator